jgi:hypothetical protein
MQAEAFKSTLSEASNCWNRTEQQLGPFCFVDLKVQHVGTSGGG